MRRMEDPRPRHYPTVLRPGLRSLRISPKVFSICSFGSTCERSGERAHTSFLLSHHSSLACSLSPPTPFLPLVVSIFLGMDLLGVHGGRCRAEGRATGDWEGICECRKDNYCSPLHGVSTRGKRGASNLPVYDIDSISISCPCCEDVDEWSWRFHLSWCPCCREPSSL
mgnify:CR=1 FL=1